MNIPLCCFQFGEEWWRYMSMNNLIYIIWYIALWLCSTWGWLHPHKGMWFSWHCISTWDGEKGGGQWARQDSCMMHSLCTMYICFSGFVGITEQQCETKGCCWYPLGHDPWCFYPTSSFPSYKVTAVNKTALGVQVSVLMWGREGEEIGGEKEIERGKELK